MAIAGNIAQCIATALGVPAIVAHQRLASATRPAKTYATVLVVGRSPVAGAPARVMAAGSGEVTISNLAARAVQVDIYGPGAEELAESLPRRLQTLGVMRQAHGLGLNLQGLGAPLNAPILRDTEHEEHAQIEIQAQRREQITDPREPIEEIQVDIEIEDQTGSPVETVTITGSTSP